MITLSTEGKTIDTGPAARLITEGEKNADVIRIEMPASYGTLDLTALTWVLAGVTDRETRVEQELAKDTSDGLALQWTVTGDWAAVPGRMRLELSGISADGAAVIKFTGRPIEVRPAAEIYGLPRPELSEQYLETMRELAGQAREAADALANAGLKILGYYDSLTALAEAVTNPQIGDLYGVGPSSEMYAYVWDGEKWAKGQALSAAAGAVSSVFGRAGEVTAQAGDYTAAQVGARPDSWMPSAADVGAVDGATGQGSAVRISNRNLLDNWYFASPVNQRGQTSYSAYSYAFDRWLLAPMSSSNTGYSVSLTDEGVDLISAMDYVFLWQRMEHELLNCLRGRVLTLSAIAGDVLYSAVFTVPATAVTSQTVLTNTSIVNGALQALEVYAAGGNSLRIQLRADIGKTVRWKAAKLELGSVSTLAHQENGAWVLNDPPPDYAEELAKCQRYQYVPASPVSKQFPIGYGYGGGTTSVRILVPTPCPLRATPSIVYLAGALNNFTLYGGGAAIAPTSIQEISVCGAGVHIIFNVSGGVANEAYVLRTTGVVPLFDANL